MTVCIQCGKYTICEEDAHQPIHRICVEPFLRRPIISQSAAWNLYEAAKETARATPGSHYWHGDCSSCETMIEDAEEALTRVEAEIGRKSE